MDQHERVIIRLPLPKKADSLSVQFFDDRCNEVGKLVELGLTRQMEVDVTALPVLTPEQIIDKICKDDGCDGLDSEYEEILRKTIKLARGGL